MRSSRTRGIVKRIAEKEGLSVKQVEDIVYSFFRYTSKRMKEGNKVTHEFKTIRLFKFGMFKVKPGRIKHLKIIHEKSNNRNKRAADNLSGSIDNKGVQENLDS